MTRMVPLALSFGFSSCLPIHLSSLPTFQSDFGCIPNMIGWSVSGFVMEDHILFAGAFTLIMPLAIKGSFIIFFNAKVALNTPARVGAFKAMFAKFKDSPGDLAVLGGSEGGVLFKEIVKMRDI